MPITEGQKKTIAKRIDKQKEKFLKVLGDVHGIIESAAKSTGVTRVTIYNWMQKDPDFAEKVEAERDLATAEIEKSLIQRAIDKDTIASIFLLKNRKPDLYGEKKTIEIDDKRKMIQVTPAFIEEAKVVDERGS